MLANAIVCPVHSTSGAHKLASASKARAPMCANDDSELRATLACKRAHSCVGVVAVAAAAVHFIDRYIDRQTDRQRDRQTDRQIQKERQADR